jgi:hypothetical protein
MSEIIFTGKQVEGMQNEKRNLVYLLKECQLALEIFPDTAYGSKTIFKSKQLLQLIKNAVGKY